MGQERATATGTAGRGVPPRLALAEARRLLDGDPRVLGRVAGALGGSGAVVVDAVHCPLGRAALRLGWPLPPWTVPLRWSPVSGVALLPAADEPGHVDVLPTHAAALPGLVARIVDLGPRPDPPDVAPPVLPAEVLDVWLRGAPRSVLDAAVPDRGARDVLVRLREGLRGTWSLSADLPDAAGRTVSRVLRVVDGGDAGLWSVTRLRAAGGVAVLGAVGTRDVEGLVAGVLATRPVDEVAA